ncbi:EXS-domain-containing protein [Artomyces pyxidatus]|uniref:EXS-domain-containing protein n=1 Tax=Artomyces pyxidatus TaxID=48021 RepID=A0ACB8TEH9_9AGAM|nr:EXS-domain-containing protein [Artomyces pyxidatus]
MFSRESRWWLVRNVARLVTSGWHRVEFTDFWLGDQFCSLTFTLGNLYFFACAYAVGFDTDPWTRCSQPSHWGVPFLLTTLPFLARLVQSIRRYADSRLITHLINGGKYGTGILYYFSYYYWRHHGGARGPSFVLWCLFGTIYATYASSWDLLMDWSLLRPHAKLRFLRSELVYSSYIPLYYCAIISNVLIRFIWVFYIPTSGPSFALRTWIAAMLEMLRRFQWNIYRLENEHLGNVDQYRITREVPLPYSFDDLSHDTDVGDVDDEEEVLEHKPVRPVAR